MEPLYTAEALATGDGRNGHGRTSDGVLDVNLSNPGGPGSGTNPEQLFAVGYAACFHSALRIVANKHGVDPTDSAVGSRVSLGSIGDGAYGLSIELEVSLPHTAPDVAQRIADDAHRVCPYSNAIRNNVDVTISVASD